jgi:methionyl-tRNA formyltransferase
MRIVFLGSGAFAIPSLEALVASGHDVAAVVTQPDREKGRGRGLAPPPLKPIALRLGLPVLQPPRIRDAAAVEQLALLRPDLLVVVAYGQILPRLVIDIPPSRTVNLHASLLPRYRGAAPIQWAIARGEQATGVTTILIDEGLDTGPILLSQASPIDPDETAGELERRLALLGAPLLVDTVEGLAGGRLTPRAQEHAQATTAPLLRKADGRLDWRQPASVLARLVRAFNPWPGAQARLGSRSIRILRARPGKAANGAPGEVLSMGGEGLVVACGEGTCLEILEVQPENRRPMSAADFVRGARMEAGSGFA